MKRKVAPVADDVIADIVAKMAEECSTIYKVADNAEIDWCPCCGINIRLRLNGEMFAKFICSPAISKQIGAKLLTTAYRAEEIQSDPVVLKQALDDVLGACRKGLAQQAPEQTISQWPYKQPPAWSEENCPDHVALSLNPKICANCGVHIDSLRPPEDEMREGEP